jgi:predicted dienelactone hydrolase
MTKGMAGIALGLAGMTMGVAHAGTGLTQLQGPTQDSPVTVFYPTPAPDTEIKRGPFTLQFAQGAEPARGNGRLVVISHGSGGNPWVHSDMARALVAAGFVVAMPQHKGDNAFDPSQPGPPSWKLRPKEVSEAIDAVARAPRFAQLKFDAVGMYGMSAGGHTALTLAGGRWSAARYRQHCEAHIADDFPACVGTTAQLNGDVLDGIKKAVALRVIGSRYTDDTMQSHEDPRIRAIVAGVPFAADFDTASLAKPRVPLGIVQAAQDRWLAPRFHSGPVLAACQPRCELLADLPTAGHGALLSPLVPDSVMGDTLRGLVGDPPGFDRSQMREVDQRIVRFLAKHLGTQP